MVIFSKHKSRKNICLFFFFFFLLNLIISLSSSNTYAFETIDYGTFSQNSIFFFTPKEPDECNFEKAKDNGEYMGGEFTGMTKEMLKKFSAAGIHENGHDGLSFELSLLANLYEEQMCGSDCPHTAEALAGFLVNGNKSGNKWFAKGTREAYENGYSKTNGTPNSSDIEIAKSVLVEGHRTAPKGIDEHDDVGDISSIKLNNQEVDKKKQSNYIRGQTIIYNKMGSTYTFYAWCDGSASKSGTTSSSCDPFGYKHKIEQTSYSTLTVNGKNTNYAGATVLNRSQLQTIENNKAIYQQAAAEYNIPWQLLATAHYAETNLSRKNPDNGQGVYQLYSYTKKHNTTFKPGETLDDKAFLFQSKLAAEFIREKAGNRDLNIDDNVKWLLFAYNGTSQRYIDRAIQMGFSEQQAKNGEGSPYVMNRYDEPRDPTSKNMSPLWKGRYTDDKKWDSNSTSDRFGTFLVYEAIGGGGESNDTCNTTSEMGELIAKTALDLSWNGRKSHKVDDPKPEYVKAMKAVDLYKNWSGYIGASCDQFVETVLLYSGVDDSSRLKEGGATGIGYYMRDNPDKYMEINFDGTNPEILQPGDIFVTYKIPKGAHGHIWIYVEIDGKPGRADASYGLRTGEHYQRKPVITDTVEAGTRYYKVYRRTQ